jgi:hypothetical protein
MVMKRLVNITILLNTTSKLISEMVRRKAVALLEQVCYFLCGEQRF